MYQVGVTMNTKIYFYNKNIGWCSVLVILLCFGTPSVFSQTQIVHHSFNSGFTRSTGNNSELTTMLGQSIFGVSKTNNIFIFTGYTLFGSSILSSVKNKNENIPLEFVLHQNFPNPFNPSTTIRYSLPSASHISIKIYNAIGQMVTELVNSVYESGWYETTWNANVASGVYFYRLDAVSTSDPNARIIQLKKMVLIK